MIAPVGCVPGEADPAGLVRLGGRLGRRWAGGQGLVCVQVLGAQQCSRSGNEVLFIFRVGPTIPQNMGAKLLKFVVAKRMFVISVLLVSIKQAWP